jgi:hypothetical protein
LINTGFKVKYLKTITVYLMVLGIFAQAINAVSAPCPMVDAVYSPMAGPMNLTSMDSPCHTDAVPEGPAPEDAAPKDDCCGEGNCPMNHATCGLLSLQSVMFKAPITRSVTTTETQLFILATISSSLYRPPIFA